MILPFVSIEDGVLEALGVTGYAVELRDVSGSDSDYWRLLRQLWGGDDLVVIEQDIRIKPDTLDAFVNCPNGWCASQYRYLGSENYTGLGCTRFRREFMLAHPDVIVAAGEYEDPTHACGHWCVTDHAVQIQLRIRNALPCVHGHVDHISDGVPSHLPCRGNG